VDATAITNLARYLATGLKSEYFDEGVEWFEADIRRHIGDLRLDRPLLPQSRETTAVAATRLKTAALIYDRVWAPPSYAQKPPDSIMVYGGTDLEIWIQAITIYLESISDFGVHLSTDLTNTPLSFLSSTRAIERALVEALARNFGVDATPIYSSVAARQEEYRLGQYEVIVASLTNLEVVDERALTWEQVLEFRNDVDMQSKYRRFVHWLDEAMVGKSQRFIEDEMHQRLEDYRASLRKHGITAAVGTLESLVDPKFVGAVSALFAGVAFTAGVTAAAVTTAALSIGNVACRLARAATDIADIRTGANAAISYVYELTLVPSKRKRAGDAG